MTTITEAAWFIAAVGGWAVLCSGESPESVQHANQAYLTAHATVTMSTADDYAVQPDQVRYAELVIREDCR